MPAGHHRSDDSKSTRGQIVTLLRRSGLTANEIAAHLGLTHNAVRGHLAGLLREGLVREGGRQRGVSRPAVVYEIVPEAEAVFSKAYIPFVANLLRVLRERMPQRELDEIMHLVGRRLRQSGRASAATSRSGWRPGRCCLRSWVLSIPSRGWTGAS